MTGGPPSPARGAMRKHGQRRRHRGDDQPLAPQKVDHVVAYWPNRPFMNLPAFSMSDSAGGPCSEAGGSCGVVTSGLGWRVFAAVQRSFRRPSADRDGPYRAAHHAAHV